MDTGNEYYLSQQIDAYLAGELTALEKIKFEQKIAHDPTLKVAVQEQKDLALMLTYLERKRLHELAQHQTKALRKSPTTQLLIFWNQKKLKWAYFQHKYLTKQEANAPNSSFPFVRLLPIAAILMIIIGWTMLMPTQVPIFPEGKSVLLAGTDVKRSQGQGTNTMVNKVSAYFKAAQYDSAIFYLNKLPSSLLEAPLVELNKGICYLHQNKGKEAVETLERALEMHRMKYQYDNNDILINLARAYLQHNDQDQAKPLLKMLLKERPKYRVEAERLLERYWWFERW